MTKNVRVHSSARWAGPRGVESYRIPCPYWSGITILGNEEPTREEEYQEATQVQNEEEAWKKIGAGWEGLRIGDEWLGTLASGLFYNCYDIQAYEVNEFACLPNLSMFCMKRILSI